MAQANETIEALTAADQDRLARILDDYLVAVEGGVSVSPEALLARYPDDAEQLRGYLSGLQLFHAAIAPETVKPAMPFPASQELAQTIGDYRLVREIGRGGMGVVYEAWQNSLHRRVALKILPFTAAHDAKQLGRFKNEAQAAAQIQHPNIVPVYTVGEEGGVNYYAMQFIEGQSLSSVLAALRSGRGHADGTTAPNNTLTVYADQKSVLRSVALPDAEVRHTPLSASESADHVRAVARMGIQAAQALYAAHEYGVVHRDIKPSNLLLDDHGKLWVTDFGLARCRENAGLTQTGDVLGTMRYMSPEQASGQTAVIDHRSDMYSLGVTLYELATLHHPAEGVSDVQLYFDRNRPGAKPLRHWDRHISFDFQTIVLKSMAATPEERYCTAQELADDLGRFLEGKPILASPPSLFSRASKWAGRHRHAVIAAGAALIVALTGMSLILAHGKATTERALAQATENFRQTHAVVDRLASLSDQLAPIPGAESVRHQLLEDCLGYYQRFEEQAVDDPSLAIDSALTYSKLGSLSEKLGDRHKALEGHKAASTIWEERVAREPSNVEYARNLALCHNNLGVLLAELGRPAESLELLTKALALQRKLLAADSEALDIAADIATSHSNLGLVHSQLGETVNAIEEFREAIAIQEPLAKSSSNNEVAMRTLAACYNNLASLYDADHSGVAAEAYQKAIAIQLQLAKSNPINRLHQGDLARTYNNLGFLAARKKDWKKAELCYADAIRIQQTLVKASPLAGAYSRDLAISYNNLGMVQSRNGRYQQAETSFREALRLQDKLLASRPTDIQTLSNQGSVYNNLGMLLDRQSRYADAEETYRRAIHYQRQANHVLPQSERFRALLSGHYYNFAKNLRSQAKHNDALQISLERKKLWAGQPDRLYSVAQELAAAYRQMNGSADASSTNQCAAAAVSTLREALGAGLSSDRLNDPSFAALFNQQDFRQLLAETDGAGKLPAASHQAESSDFN